MRISQLLFKTQKEIPSEADTDSHGLLLRSGFIAQLAAGIYSYTPLAWRSIQKIQEIIRQEMNRYGGQEINMPVLQPLELWQKTGRDLAFGKSLFNLVDRKSRPLVLGPTHEEAVTDLVSRFVQSYRNLPLTLYQLQTKFRDEPRPRAGLIRVREFIMKDAYSFHANVACLDNFYESMKQAYLNIYQHCGLQALMIDADSGAIGGKSSHEFILVTPTGEDSVLYCPKCGYAANSEKAAFQKNISTAASPLPLQEVATPHKKSIEEVSAFLNISPSQILKTVLYMADGQMVMTLIRGDYAINEIKLKNALKCRELREATLVEIAQKGLIAGYCGPIGVKNLLILADESVQEANLASGANSEGKHCLNSNYGRDFSAERLLDLALAHRGLPCPCCASPYEEVRGIEVGHIFKLGTVISEALNAEFTDEDGVSRPLIMGCYGIGVGRLLAAAVEQNHDQNGIIWPLAIAPYQVLITPLYGQDSKETAQAAEKLYADLWENGIETLLDDRSESAGVKFNDADLIGIPIRITIGKKTLAEKSCEVKRRDKKEVEKVSLEETAKHIQSLISQTLKQSR